MTTEPECCGEPMVHNSFMEQYECADAYFGLVDDGVLPDTGVSPRVTYEDMTPDQQASYDHWRASWIPDPNRIVSDRL